MGGGDADTESGSDQGAVRAAGGAGRREGTGGTRGGYRSHLVGPHPGSRQVRGATQAIGGQVPSLRTAQTEGAGEGQDRRHRAGHRPGPQDSAAQRSAPPEEGEDEEGERSSSGQDSGPSSRERGFDSRALHAYTQADTAQAEKEGGSPS